MRKLKTILVSLLFLAVCGTVLAQTATRLEINKKYLNLLVNDIETLQVEVSPQSGVSYQDITWVSSNPYVATVDPYGTVNSISKGETIITATMGVLSAACLVHVVDLEFTVSTLKIYVGERKKLSLSAPVDGLDWTIDDSDIASLRGLDDGAEIFAKQPGLTSVTVSRGHHRKTCFIETEYRQVVAVDMGLPSGVKWASRNVGADFMTDIGDIFPVQAAAGGPIGWRGLDWDVPCDDDFNELFENCYWEFTTFRRVNGVLFTSKINGNQIFLPGLTINWGAYWFRQFATSFGVKEISDRMSAFDGVEMVGNSNDEFPIRAVYVKEVDNPLRVVDLQLYDCDEDLNVIDPALFTSVSDIKYLLPEIRLFSRTNQSVQFGIKIFNPEGVLETYDGSANGFTYLSRQGVSRGYSTLRLGGWGTPSGGSFSSGQYRIEIWKGYDCLYSSSFTLSEEPLKYTKLFVTEEAVDGEPIPFQLVEAKPSFNGGDANDFSRWVNSQLRYPEIAKENGVQGRVTLQFTVEADGRVTNVQVLRGVDESLDKEAVRVVSSSPRWKPGRQRDRRVKVTYTFPVIFQLR